MQVAHGVVCRRCFTVDPHWKRVKRLFIWRMSSSSTPGMGVHKASALAVKTQPWCHSKSRLPSLNDCDTWTSNGCPWKRLRKVVTGIVFWPYSTGRKSSHRRKRLSFTMFLRANEDPNAGLWKTWSNPNSLSKGSTKVDFPELVGPIIIGTRVVLDGPFMRMFRRATANSARENAPALAAKKAEAAAA